uniref:GDSL esterase/lipase n=1 Tax=Aegilops tauschii subsp. strangulata TaxID=200361 RepID=A0A452Z4R8_AEGTS
MNSWRWLLGKQLQSTCSRGRCFFCRSGARTSSTTTCDDVSGVQMHYLPWEFNQLLVNAVRQEIKNLYNINVRKVVLMGPPPVGCAPHFLSDYGSLNGECIDYINNVVIEFNYGLRYMSREFIRQYPDPVISYCDTFEGSVDILENRVRYAVKWSAKSSHFGGTATRRLSDYH